jgi:hypothetical protein
MPEPKGPDQTDLDVMLYIEGVKVDYPHLFFGARTPELRVKMFDEGCLDAILHHAFLHGWRAGSQEGHRSTTKAIAESFDSALRVITGDPNARFANQTTEGSGETSQSQQPPAGDNAGPER